MKNITLLCSFLAIFSSSLYAQKQLVAASEPGLLDDVKINAAMVLTEAENQAVISVDCKVKNGKSFAIQGKVLDASKKEIIHFESSTEEISKEGGVIDLTVKFKPNDSFRHNKPILKTHFVELTFAPLETEGDMMDLLSELDKEGKLNKLFSSSFIYELKKDWRVPGNPGIVINVPIVPIGKANDIVTKTTPVILKPTVKIDRKFSVNKQIYKTAVPASTLNKSRVILTPATGAVKKSNSSSKKKNSSTLRYRPATSAKLNPTVYRRSSTASSKPAAPAASKSTKGPTNKQFIVTDKILSDIDFSEADLFSIDELVFRDHNIHSGYYYYYPAKFSLSWNPTKKQDKYDLNFNFGTNGKVTVTALLKPKVSRKDREILTALLKNNIKNTEEKSYGIKKFTPLPLMGAPDIQFSGLSQFGIQPEDVSVSAPSKLDDPIKMTFTTENINDLTNMLFNDIGLYGKVIIHPDGEEMMDDIEIPFSMKIDDPETYGKFVLPPGTWRRGWQNPTDYPITLAYMHALVAVNGEYQVYSWDLKDTEIPEYAKVKFTNVNKVPAWIDKKTTVKQIWMEYTTQACNTCNAKLIEEFIKGYEPVEEKKVRIRVQNALEFTEADVIYLTIRSYQGEATGRTNKEFEVIEIDSDGKTISEGPFYVKEGTGLDYEYKIEVVMPDGEVHETAGWVKHSRPVLPVGAATIKKHVPFFKAKAITKDGGVPRRRN